MQSERPKIQRVYVQVFLPDSRKSKSKAYYNTTADEIFRVLDSHASKVSERQRRQPAREPATA